MSEYQLAIQNPKVFLQDPELKSAEVERQQGYPRAFSGGFALTYHLTSKTGQFAVRCFHRYAPDIQERYDAISGVLGSLRSDLFLKFSYQDKGILVNGSYYPIVKMDWVAGGQSLALFVERNLQKPAALRKVAENFRQAVRELKRLGIAHGDLQHGNVLVQGTDVRLIDYDGMFVPRLKGRAANELGQRNYQHPQRTSANFDADLDHFSSILIYVSLLAIADNPDLWRDYNSSENLIFTAADYSDPEGSELLDDLKSQGGSQAQYYGRLETLFRAKLETIPPLEDWLQGREPGQRSTAVLTPVRGLYEVYQASDRDKLLEMEGDYAEVVGVVQEATKGFIRGRVPYWMINFGDWKEGCFTVVLWPNVLKDWKGLKLDSLKGTRVAVTGLIQKYTDKNGERTCPQIVLEHWNKLRLAGPEVPRRGLADPMPRPPKALPTRNKQVLDRLKSGESPKSDEAPAVKPKSQAPAPQKVSTRAKNQAILEQFNPSPAPAPPPPPTPPPSPPPTGPSVVTAQAQARSPDPAQDTPQARTDKTLLAVLSSAALLLLLLQAC